MVRPMDKLCCTSLVTLFLYNTQQEHYSCHIPKGIRDFGSVPEGTSTMRGENTHCTYKSIVSDSHNRRDVVGMPARNHDRKIAFLTKRQPIVSPIFVYKIKELSKKAKKDQKAITQRREAKWANFGKGPIQELKSLSVMNTKIRKKTYYFKSVNEMVRIDYLILVKQTEEVGFVGKLFRYVEDKSTGVLKIQKIQRTKWNLVILDSIKTTFIGRNDQMEHMLRRACYYEYDIPQCKNCNFVFDWQFFD